MWSSRLIGGSACDTLARLTKEIAYVTVANGRTRSQRSPRMKCLLGAGTARRRHSAGFGASATWSPPEQKRKLSRIIWQRRWFDEKHSARYNNAGVASILRVAPGNLCARDFLA